MKKLTCKTHHVSMTTVALASVFVASAHGLTASVETQLRDPWVPDDTRKAAAAAPTPAQTSGAELQKQVEQKLKKSFDAAVIATRSDGTLTAAQAQAAGLGFVAKHFNEIDQKKSGAVRFEEVTRFMNQRGARLIPFLIQ